jgi:hypothetical protein
LSYEFSARSNASFYLSASAGFRLLLLARKISSGERARLDTTRKHGLALATRAGLRLFRLYDFGCDIFAASYWPLFKTNDPDSLLIDRHTPSLQLGPGHRLLKVTRRDFFSSVRHYSAGVSPFVRSCNKRVLPCMISSCI